MTEDALKPEPLTVSVKLGAPAVVTLGVIEVIAGPAPTVNTAGADVTGPGLTTVMLTEAGAVRRFAGTAAVS